MESASDGGMLVILAMEREVVLRGRILAIMIPILILAAAGSVAGCGGSQDATAWLEDCRRAASDYAQGDGYLHFVQEMDYSLGLAQGEFEQKLRVEGDIIFPDREAYEYKETQSSSQQPGQAQENAFSYLTLDRGKTAYVSGKRLSEELGVIGWVHYTPMPEQNRYFDYAALMDSLSVPGGETEWLGFEDMNGERCARIRYGISGQELIDLRMQEDPSLLEQYQGLDMGEIMGELSVEMWIGEADRLPRQVVMGQATTLEDGASSTTHLLMVFSGYGEEPPAPIETPAFASEAV